MGKSPLNLTKQSKVLGVPLGRKHTDWKKVAMLGASAASSVAGGLGAKRKAAGGLDKGKEMLGKVSSVTDQAGKVGSAMSGAASPVGKVAEAAKSMGSGGSGSDTRNVQKLRMIIRETVEVGVPKTVAYNQWTQFTELPSIVKGVDAVEQEEDDLVEWTAKIGPSRRTWKAEITEQVPDEKIAWQSKEGPENRGVISFHELDANLTLVAVEMEYFPSGLVEKFGNIFLVARRRVRKDLRLFKHYIELAGEETGAWRGEISKDDEEFDSDNDEQEEQDDVRAEDDSEDSEIDLTEDEREDANA